MRPFPSFALCLIIFLYTFTGGMLHAHGLGEATLVKTWGGSKSIKNIADNVSKNKKIVSYKFSKNRCTTGYIQSSGKSETNCYISIEFDNPLGPDYNDLSCTPAQEFYLPVIKKWVPACELKVGKKLQSDSLGLVAFTSIKLVDRPITVYSLEVGKHHNLFVGKYFVLTHNMALPWTCSTGISFSFGAGGGATAGGKAGSCFGPAGIVGGIVVGGILGWAIEKYANSDKIHQYISIFDTKIIGTSLKKDENVQTPENQDKGEEAKINGGKGANDTPLSNDPPRDKTPTNLEDLEGERVEHFIEGSKGSNHKWELLVPEKNWEEIKKIAKEVLETGNVTPYKKIGKAKVKEIKGETVEITYFDDPINDIRKISNGWMR